MAQEFQLRRRLGPGAPRGPWSSWSSPVCIPPGEKTLGHRKGDRHLKDGSGIRNKVASISNKVMGVGNKMAGEIRGTWLQVTGQ